jgi:hypothetical protein
MKRILLTLVLCLSSTLAFAQYEEFQSLLSEEGHVESSNVYKDPRYTGQKFDASYVRIETNNGYKFHVADYSGGNRIVTCLNGEMMGYQGIAYNGVQFAESTIVEWHSKHFVHYYTDGEVISYPAKQTAKFN